VDDKGSENIPLQSRRHTERWMWERRISFKLLGVGFVPMFRIGSFILTRSMPFGTDSVFVEIKFKCRMYKNTGEHFDIKDGFRALLHFVSAICLPVRNGFVHSFHKLFRELREIISKALVSGD
jgi:hypothetical protein